MEKYRFDDAYEKVFEYDNESNAYLFYGTYFDIGINQEMSEAEKIQTVEEG